MKEEYSILIDDYQNLLKQKAKDDDGHEKLLNKFSHLQKELEEKRELAHKEGNKLRKLQERVAELESNLSVSKENEHDLKEKVSQLASLEQQVEMLKERLTEGGSWCETAAAALSSRSEDLQAALSEASAARRDSLLLSEQLASALERASSAETALKIAKEEVVDAEMARDSIEKSLEMMKEESRTLRAQHREMTDIIGALREAEEQSTERNNKMSIQISATAEELAAVKSELSSKISETEVLGRTLEQTSKNLESLQSNLGETQERERKLVLEVQEKTRSLQDAHASIDKLVCEIQDARNELENADRYLSEKAAVIIDLESELTEYKATAATEKRAVELLHRQCESLREELEFMRGSISKDSAMQSNQFDQLVKMTAEERDVLREEVSRLSDTLQNIRDELSKSREDTQDAITAKLEAESKMFSALEESKSLAGRLAAIERDMAVLEVVKEQSQREAMEERDEAVRCKVYCKEAEREVNQLRADYEMMSKSLETKIRSLDPVLNRIHDKLAAKFGRKTSIEEAPLIQIQTTSEQGDSYSETLKNVEWMVDMSLEMIAKYDEKLKDHCLDQDSWEGQKKAFKLVARLAMSIAMDHVTGSDDARRSLFKLQEDKSVMDALKSAGLQNVWHSLIKLATTSSGEKLVKKLAGTTKSLEETKFSLEQMKLELNKERSSRLTVEDAVLLANQNINSMISSILAASVEGSVLSSPDSEYLGLKENLELCIESLKSSLGVLLRRYRSMARTIRSISKSQTNGEKLRYAINATCDDACSPEEKIPAMRL